MEVLRLSREWEDLSECLLGSSVYVVSDEEELGRLVRLGDARGRGMKASCIDRTACWYVGGRLVLGGGDTVPSEEPFLARGGALVAGLNER
ncbi:hypothetical protein SERLADRAFT_465492 [Serpula lacrymans var. lacrymans S7.9]|uniref:Uncharacterized protein n=1 Tax=Serpula lacrymans var. lacrymans (strain S7.9) TaxID=578457 RepID=F8NVJ2_SERL9|nr:uncharacterized protein SERLADRAFT_465492 [Serpula lacrymans var. lacrymans S7.9]EGO25401.1 hypothetical protein SERLADRAFT_465492 [Serpula lacrymans var. lacrymans S7.9]